MQSFNLSNYVQETLAAYLKLFPTEIERFEILKTQLHNSENLGTRKNFNGHMTASAYLVHEGKCLLIHHIGLDKWLAPGGHWEEGDNELFNSAFRELREEIGITNAILHPWHTEHQMLPIDIDTHPIPHNPKKNEDAHYHHDFRYIFMLKDPTSIQLQAEEVSDFDWLELENFPPETGTQRVKEKIITLNLIN